ncbi:MAG: hypothetical protein PHE49_11140, partial [bacterium]|nr:hypothetical protein [bacterium]
MTKNFHIVSASILLASKNVSAGILLASKNVSASILLASIFIFNASAFGAQEFAKGRLIVKFKEEI